MWLSGSALQVPRLACGRVGGSGCEVPGRGGCELRAAWGADGAVQGGAHGRGAAVCTLCSNGALWLRTAPSMCIWEPGFDIAGGDVFGGGVNVGGQGGHFLLGSSTWLRIALASA